MKELNIIFQINIYFIKYEIFYREIIVSNIANLNILLLVFCKQNFVKNC